MPLRPGFDPKHFDDFGKEYLPGLVGLVLTDVAEGLIRGELAIRKVLLAPNGYLHAGTVIAFADTLCGYGCLAHLPERAENFTTLELKANFLNTAREGRLHGEARAVHLGRTTQVWDASVNCGERKLALFRCTQLVIYPKEPDGASRPS
jgi:1,4-dihydroxy-2-naphthoyl-CoA hydrolase